jgi:ribosomal protein S18 acetylase RimI-like enzyme
MSSQSHAIDLHAVPVIEPLPLNEHTIAALTAMLVETVAHGGSVSFMHPLNPAVAAQFWTRSLEAAEAGKRIVLGALAEDQVVATVTLDLETPPNQPHRAEIAKMMTRMGYRGRGIARRLMIEAERIAADHGRTLLTLDTAGVDGAAGFYEKLGFQRAGEIPDYALLPFGGLNATILYFKRIGDAKR